MTTLETLGLVSQDHSLVTLGAESVGFTTVCAQVKHRLTPPAPSVCCN